MSATEISGKLRFGGLDGLRFLAALFVVIGHIPLNQESRGLPNPHWGALFYRGAPAVAFFFTLSGFLITYLLLAERERTGTISVRAFYLRRVCRIWPLYFAVVAFGLIFYNALLPKLGITYPVAYSIPTAVVLYSFFLPNLMNSLYTVGGILNPLWSIGIEEQFYLAWAPAVKRWHARLPWLLGGVLVVSLVLFGLCLGGFFGPGWPTKFVGQLKFHFMAAGGLAAWWLHRDRAGFLSLSPFRWRWLQIVLFAIVADYYLVNLLRWRGWPEELMQLALYVWLIVDVGANPRRLVGLRHRVLDELGAISYGIYMIHMIVVYATTALFEKTTWWHGRPVLYVIAYYVLAVGGTLLLAHLSYRYFESPFLRLKERKYAVRTG